MDEKTVYDSTMKSLEEGRVTQKTTKRHSRKGDCTASRCNEGKSYRENKGNCSRSYSEDDKIRSKEDEGHALRF